MADKQSVEAMKVNAAMQLARLGGDAEVDMRTMNGLPESCGSGRRGAAAARINGDYAPFAGIVTQVETVQPGMYLAAATAAFGLVSTMNGSGSRPTQRKPN